MFNKRVWEQKKADITGGLVMNSTENECCLCYSSQSWQHAYGVSFWSPRKEKVTKANMFILCPMYLGSGKWKNGGLGDSLRCGKSGFVCRRQAFMLKEWNQSRKLLFRSWLKLWDCILGRKEEPQSTALLLPNLKWEMLPRGQCPGESFWAVKLSLRERRLTQATRKSQCLRDGWITTTFLSVFPGCWVQLLSSQSAQSYKSHSGTPNSPFTLYYIIFCWDYDV